MGIRDLDRERAARVAPLVASLALHVALVGAAAVIVPRASARILDAIPVELVAIEPLSENALKLQGEGYKQSAKVDAAVKTAEQVLALPADVKASDFAATGNGATLTLSATGRAPQTPTGKPLPAAPVPIVVEFLDSSGGVVTSQEAQIPQLATGSSQDVKVAAQGGGIIAWRYKRK